MNQPPFLKPGDRIAIAATARKISLPELQAALDTFTAWGLETVFSPTLFEAENQFGGTDEQRAAGFQQLLDDDTVRAIIVARGGYGTVRMVDRLDFSRFAANPKWIIGFSDVTVLHCHVQQLLAIPTLHATMAFSFEKQLMEGEALSSLRSALFGEALHYTFPAHDLNRQGGAAGELIGGNLSVLYSLLGSVSFPDMDGKILFLEDLDEYLYHIDRMLMGLKRAGALSNLAGLVVGGMTDMKDNTIPFGKTAEEIIGEAVAAYNYPVCFGFPAGHIMNNCALKLGVPYALQVGTAGSVLTEKQ